MMVFYHPRLAQNGDEPQDGLLKAHGLVPAARLEQRQDHLAGVALEDHQRHVAVAVIVGVEEGQFLAPVGVHVRVVAVKDDVARGAPLIGKDEHRDEHLLYAEQVFVGDHVLEAAHGGRGTEFLVKGVRVNGQLHHRVSAHTVAVVDILVAEAYLEYARHDDFMEPMAHQIGNAGIAYATGQPGSQRQMLLFLTEHQQAAMGGQAHGVGHGLQLEVFDRREVEFPWFFLITN